MNLYAVGIGLVILAICAIAAWQYMVTDNSDSKTIWLVTAIITFILGVGLPTWGILIKSKRDSLDDPMLLQHGEL